MTDLRGKAALVTGASRGIGAAIAVRLAERGAAVAVMARNAASLADVAERIRAGDGQAHVVVGDVARYDDVAAAVEICVKAFGRLDILVNNAGVIEPIARLADSDPEVWALAVDINLKGVYHGLRAAIPVMAAQGAGTIVNLSSGAANSALEGWSHYCATKAAAKKLTECAHKEVGDRGIRVVGLSPGTVATEMMAQIKRSGINPVSQLDWSTHIPPEWVGEAVVYLCGAGGAELAGTDFSLKTIDGRRRVGLPTVGATA